MLLPGNYTTDVSELRNVLLHLSSEISGVHSKQQLSDLIRANQAIWSQLAELSACKGQLKEENQYLREEISQSHPYTEIVGSSKAILPVFELISQVSDSPSTVLLLGETGTGKELLARAIHAHSSRKEKPMIKVNCAALPEHLIESELFGHERGAFTGAMERRIGKFELAGRSTLFLDEIGELPLFLQTKLLRVLQEKEFERVGGTHTIRADVRIVAATNRNLYKEVQAGNFRSDLFFRLNVFPIIIPPLRDRKEDIPTLVAYFLAKYANHRKGRMQLTARAMKELIAYEWPGNVRELEHVIERSILISTGTKIDRVAVFPEGGSGVQEGGSGASSDVFRVKSIDEVEREHILSVLKKCNNKVAGIGGAAELLGIPSTTLNSKMRRLNIQKKLHRI